MVKALLHSDRTCWPDAGPPSVTVKLDGDCRCPDGTGDVVEVRPLLTIRTRLRGGHDDLGAPLFAWVTLQAARANLWTERREVDNEGGRTLVKGSAVMPNVTGIVELPETAVVVDDQNIMWAITSSYVLPGRIELQLERTAHDGAVGEQLVAPEPQVSSYAAADAIRFGHGAPTDTGPFEGSEWVDLDTAKVYVWQAGGWVELGDLTPYDLLVLGPSDPVPPGTQPGTVIVRTI